MDGQMSCPELYACLYAEQFPVQALLRIRQALRNYPCAVMEGDPPLQFVCSQNRQAHELGIVRGMTQAEIDTFPQAAILTRSKVEEASAKAALLECAGTFSP